MRYTQEVFTPETAKEWLDSYNHGNRKPRPRDVRRYAGMMERGEWHPNSPEPLAVAAGGKKLLQGQHRLLAVVRSGATVPLWVAWDVPEDVMPILDTGAGRHTGDVLSLLGHRYAPVVARAAKLAILLSGGSPNRHFTSSTGTISNPQVLAFLEANPDFEERVVFTKRYLAEIAVSDAQIAALYHAFARAAGPAAAREFFERLAEGANLEPSSPVLVLRRTLEKDARSRRRRHAGDTMALVVKAWNAWLTGAEIRLLKMHDGESFPVIAGRVA